MKQYNLLMIFLLLFCTSTNAQTPLKRLFIKIDQKINAQKLNEISINTNSNITKKDDCLHYYCNSNSELLFCDNYSEENYVEYKELGIIKNSEIIVVQKMTYNKEFFIMINQKLCNQITIKGFPLKIENSDYYVVYNNPSTDEPFIIQIIKITNGIFILQDEITLPEYIKPKRFFCLDDNKVFILDEKNQIWKTNIQK